MGPQKAESSTRDNYCKQLPQSGIQATSDTCDETSTAVACQHAAIVWPVDASKVSITCQYTVPCGLCFAYVGDTLCYWHYSSGKLYPLQTGAVAPCTGLRAQLLGACSDSNRATEQPGQDKTHQPEGVGVHFEPGDVTLKESRAKHPNERGRANTSAEETCSLNSGQHIYTIGQASCSPAAENLHTAGISGVPSDTGALGFDDVFCSDSRACDGCAVTSSSLCDLPDGLLDLIGRHLLPEHASADDCLDTAYAAAALACSGSRATLTMAHGAWDVLDPRSLNVASWVNALDKAVAQSASLQAAPTCRMIILPHKSPNKVAWHLLTACHRALESLSQLANHLSCPVRQRTSLLQQSQQPVTVVESKMCFRLSLEDLLQITPSGSCSHPRGAVRRASIAKHGFAKFQELQAQPHVHLSPKKAVRLEEQYRTLAVTPLLAQHNLTLDTLPDGLNIRGYMLHWVAGKGDYSTTPSQVVDVVVQRFKRLQTATAAHAQ